MLILEAATCSKHDDFNLKTVCVKSKKPWHESAQALTGKTTQQLREFIG